MKKDNRSLGKLAVSLLVVLSVAGCGLSPVPFGSKEQPASSLRENVQVNSTQKENEDKLSDVSQPQMTYDSMEAEASEVMSDMEFDYEVPEFNTEEYASLNETGFVATSATPLSTISADVDTASYANLRRMLVNGYAVEGEETKKNEVSDRKSENASVIEDAQVSRGMRKVIPTGAVRIEEMLNYFDYDYALPKGEDGFALSAKIGACPWNKDTELLVLGCATAKEDEGVRQKGANLVFLIDVSGSMDDPDKLPLLQNAFSKLVESLGEKDRVSIVTYSSGEEVVLEGQSGADQREILKAIRSLKAEGSTNGEAGLRMAYDMAKKHYIEGGVNRIVLASDGDLNVGMTSESELHDFVKGKRDEGVYLSVLGFGEGNYKDTKMETLADNGNGSYHYIDCEREAERVFGQCLTANLVPFADDVKVQLEFNPSQIKAYRLIGYENRSLAAEDFADDKKDAGEVRPNSQFSVVYEIVRPDSKLKIDAPELKYGQQKGSGSDSGEWITAKLRYKPIGKNESKEQELTISDGDWSKDPGDDWRFAAAVAEFGMILRNSENKGTSSYDEIRGLVGKTNDELRNEFLDLVDLAEKN